MGGDQEGRKASKRPQIDKFIDFSNKDLDGVTIPRQEPMVISIIIQKARVPRVLVDIGASVDILYWDVFINLRLQEGSLKASHAPIKGFGQSRILVARRITLPMTLGKGEQTTTVEVDFTVVRFASGYNAILGRATLHTLQAIISTYHQCLKFPTSSGTCCVKGSQQTTQSCYVMLAYSSESARQARKRWEEEAMANITPKNQLKMNYKEEPTSKTETIELEGGVKVQVGSQLKVETRKELIHLLQQNTNSFSTESSIMECIHQDHIEHQLSMNLGVNQSVKKYDSCGQEEEWLQSLKSKNS